MRFCIEKLFRTSFAAAAVLLWAVAACSPNRDAAAPGQPDLGGSGTVHKTTINDLETLLAAARGRVAVVNFWATWCAPCVAEMPELAEFYLEHPREQVAFYALSLDAVDEIENTVKPFLKEREVPFPVHVLAERDIEAVSKTVRSEISGALPVTLVYDRRGNVTRMWEGAITLEELNGLVKPLI